ncbi:uncharacterized protein LOC135346511 isoform X2 [Halichondria panicea]|uniref:uncharacterized protein LOC135346511 isoform X2 n=1 Tax=Halichondria panicea TaxID=6063 RepID=UPI00312B4578
MVHLNLRNNHCVVVSAVVSLLSQVLQATPGLVLPVERTTGLGCIPEGRTVSYECTVTDDDGSRSTLWRGSAFNCSSSSSRILLIHILFQPNGESRTCGGLSAMSVGVSEDNYTSRLTLTATVGLNGSTVECSRSGTVVLGSDTLRTGSSPSPAQSVMVDVTSTSFLTVSWTPPSDTSNVGRYMFTVTGEDCGCESMNISPSTTSVSCSGWTPSGQTCSFEVRTVSQDCGFISDSVAQGISLRVPSSPTGLQVMTLYNQYGSTDYLEVHFMGVSTSPLGANLDSTISYTVTLTGTRATLQFNGVNCNTTNYCTLRVNGSQISPADRYTVSVVASNIFGQGAPVIFANLVGVCLVECDPEVLGASPSSQRSAGSVAVPNGVVTYSGVVLGSVATLTCDTEYYSIAIMSIIGLV